MAVPEVSDYGELFQTTTAAQTPNMTDNDRLLQTARIYRIVVTSILIPFGTVGNVIAFIVLSRPAMRGTTTGFFLRILAVGDLAVLWLSLFLDFIGRVQDKRIEDNSDFACKAVWFMIIMTTNVTSWLLVLISFDRFISVWLPFKKKIICTRRNATISVVVMCILLLIINTILCWRRFEEVNGKCLAKSGVWAWVNSAIYSLVPGTILVICSVLIIAKLWARSRSNIAGSSLRIKSNVIVMLALNVTFLVTTSPTVIVFAATDIGERLVKGDGGAELETAVLHMLFYWNSGLNFILYCISGSRFRKELKDLFQSKHYPPSVETPKGTTSSL